ncbi:hypothetical protein VTJ83DRAFT_1990 [Remersonia thermophila]|uniref:Uncharacterized protein n=1 Tax=Remersonia thermophila TaxID=72144 RepID=A0ABR4DHF7_9PEZI
MEQAPQPPPTPTTPFTPTTPVASTNANGNPDADADANLSTPPATPTAAAPPDPFRQPRPTLTARRSRLSPAFRAKLSLMATRLAPLVQLTTGRVHPAFPRTVLAFWLLTDAELDDLARFYHQRTPGPWTARYPCPVAWPDRGRGMSTEQKRRRMGRFIGLRGCESPVGRGPGPGGWPSPVSAAFLESGGRHQEDVDMGGMGEALEEVARRSEEEILEQARREREREDEVDEMRRKMGWY